MAFQYKSNGATLTPAQESILETIENAPSPFRGIAKLKDLRMKTKVLVIVSDRAGLITKLENDIKKIETQISIYRREYNSREIYNQIEEDICGRLNWAKEQLSGAKSQNIHLLGLYTRKLLWFDTATPVIYLFADNIKDHAERRGVNVDNVFAFVFVHEMMHAYFDAINSDGFPSREPIEEAFAEYGMLTFINKNKSLFSSSTLLEDAKNDVKSKISRGPREYGFGYDLFDLTSGGIPGMIERYGEISNWIDLDVIRSWTGKYHYFNDIKNYPSPIVAKQCFEGVKEVLNYQWKKPHFNIQKRIRGSLPLFAPSSGSMPGSSAGSKPGVSLAMPILSDKEEWAFSSTKIGWDAQYPLVRKNDFVELLTVILKVMKNEGLESYSSLSGDDLMFIGHKFSKYTENASRSIPESLCVKGTTVYLDGWSPKRCFVGQMGNVLYALSILFDSTFTIVHENSNYTLYGPIKHEPLFSETPSTPVAKPRKTHTFEIIDIDTDSVLQTIYGMRKTVLFVVENYCSRNPSKTLADLQNDFAKVKNHTSSDMNNLSSIIESKATVEEYKMLHPGDGETERFFEDNPITLSNGEVILVSNQWAGENDKRDKDNFSEFKAVARGLGYDIRVII